MVFVKNLILVLFILKKHRSTKITRESVRPNSMGQDGLEVPKSFLSRLIIYHSGSAKHGFIEGAQLVFQS